MAQTYKRDPRKDFIRHYDVTRKVCPRYFVNNVKAWEQFKLDCYNYMIGKLKESNIRNCTNGKGNSIIEEENIGTPAPPINPLGVYEVTADVLNVRAGVGTTYKIIDSIKLGEKVTITKIDGRWGYVEDKNGWISLAYAKFIEENFKQYIIKVRADVLNGRAKPSTDSDIICKLEKGTAVTIVAKEGKWLKTKMGYYIHGDYVEFVKYI